MRVFNELPAYCGPVGQLPGLNSRGVLIVNADDWGRDRKTTDRTLECILPGAVSSASAMVFMEDSERGAEIARTRGIDVGLHLNLTTCFSSTGVSVRLKEYQQRVSSYLRQHRLAQAIFHPGLTRCFEYVVAAQCEEFQRLYGSEPGRIDGHHHMHLCSNVLLGGLLPAGTVVRRTFSFDRGEKSVVNRLYRRAVDRMLGRRYYLTDFFYSLPPLDPNRVRAIFAKAKDSVVEVETHPVNIEEYRFLAEGEIFRWTVGVQVAPSYMAAGKDSVMGKC
jgi:predicted glycoside hydrolase/deacetylase ChbG (UPF0249 family)